MLTKIISRKVVLLKSFLFATSNKDAYTDGLTTKIMITNAKKMTVAIMGARIIAPYRRPNRLKIVFSSLFCCLEQFWN